MRVGSEGIEFGTLISNDLASDGTVLGYTGANRNTGKTFIRLPSGAEVPVNGLFHANAVNNRYMWSPAASSAPACRIRCTQRFGRSLP